MKLLGVTLDEHENPQQFHVTLSKDELALIARIFGQIPFNRMIERSGDQRWADAMFDLNEGAFKAFNMFYDDGHNDVIPKFNFFLEPHD